MAANPQPLSLPPRMDADAAVHLMEELLAFKHDPISVDASDVQQMSTLCVQVLLSARRCWERDGLGFSVKNPSTAFRESVKLLGADILLT